jgi:polar amino acid transport system substrate-binding protein
VGAVLKRIVSRGALRIGMSGYQPPFNLTSVSGEYFGMEVDLARALSGALGVKMEIVIKPFAELLPAVESGEIDLAMSSITMTPRRNMSVAFVGPYFSSGKALLTKNETLAAAEAGKHINKKDLRLVALKGSTSEDFVRFAAPEAQITVVGEYSEGVRAVAEDRADAMVADFPMVLVTLLRHPNAGFAGASAPLSFEPIGVAVPANDPHFINLVTNYVTLLEGTGLMEGLREKWFKATDWLQLLPPEHFGTPLDPDAGPLFGAPATEM